MRPHLALLLLVPLAAGCGDSSEDLIHYRQTGGIVPGDALVQVDVDGEIRLDVRGLTETSMLFPDQLAALRARIEEARIPTLEDEYLQDGRCADHYTYTITARVGRDRYTVKADSPACTTMPDGLADLIDELDVLIDMFYVKPTEDPGLDD